MEYSHLALAAGVIFFAYTVRGIAGFGSGLIAVPALSLWFPVQLVVPFVVLLDFAASLTNGLRGYKHIVWREQLPLVPFTFVGVAMGGLFLSSADKPFIAKLLGGFLLLYAVYQLFPFKTPQYKGKWPLAIVCGLLGGAIGSVFASGGPMYIMYFDQRGMSTQALKATFSANFLIDGGLRLATYMFVGLFYGKVIWALVAGAILMFSALYFGNFIHTRVLQIDKEKKHKPAELFFKRGIGFLLLCTGSMLLYKYWAL